MTMVDSIMGCLAPSSANQSRAKRINLSPNVLMSKLQPLLGISKIIVILDFLGVEIVALPVFKCFTLSHVSVLHVSQHFMSHCRCQVFGSESMEVPSHQPASEGAWDE